MRRMLLAVTLLAVCAGLSSAQFYGSMGQLERERLAEDYYLAGGQYVATGAPEKGQSFQELALLMYPGLNPANIREVEQPSAAELLAKSDIAVAGPPESDTTPNLIRSRLLRFIGSVLTESADAVVQNIDGSVYLSDPGLEASRGDVYREMLALFGKVSLRGIQPSRLYNLDSLKVARATAELASRGWGEVYTADIDAGMDLRSQLSVWRQHQRFYLRMSSRSWLIFAFGDSPPPAGWKPASPTALPAAAVQPLPMEQRATIEAGFMDCVARFLQKDSEGALRYFAPRVRLERLGATIAREELGKAFGAYFQSMSFGGLKTEDLVEPQSVFVAESDRFPELAAGKRYVLTVRTRLDLAEQIPFWTKFQEYYFTPVDGSWRIFAIF